MELSLTQDFPASLDRLWSAFGQPDYPRRKYLALGAKAVRLLQHSATAELIELELEREVPVDRAGLPAWARLMLGSELEEQQHLQTLRHHTAWRRFGSARATAELDISFVGLPVHAHGVATIVESASEAALASPTTRLQLDWRVESRVPVIGGKLERLFADQLRAALEADHAFTLQYLLAVEAKQQHASRQGLPAHRAVHRAPRSNA